MTLRVGKLKLSLRQLSKIPRYIIALPAVLILRMIRPCLLVRIGLLISSRIGHFAANTEIYLCERAAGINVPSQRTIDIFYLYEPISNRQLAVMWRRLLRIWPSWILAPVARLNSLIPGGKVHEIGQNTQHDRDVHNLLDRLPPQLQFNAEEEVRGEFGLRAIGIPLGMPFICLNVRDSAYLDGPSWAYHSYRDSDVNNYVVAAEALAELGYFVIRMGAKVHAAMNTAHPRIIDYAVNGMRSDFMDIYLGAKCTFCISSGSGWDCVPEILRRPIIYVNYVPVGAFRTFLSRSISITKKHIQRDSHEAMTFPRIFSHGLGFCRATLDYESKDVDLIENTPKEIRDVAIEMVERLNGTWKPHPADDALQRRFWEIFPADERGPNGMPYHGQVLSRVGAQFLRDNSLLLEV